MRRSRDHADLVRRMLRTERGLKGYRPTVRHYAADPPPAPKHADEVLAALSGRYRPGDAIGLQQIVDVIDVPWEVARAVRDWAQQTGAWPYLRPGPGRPVGKPDRLRGSSRRWKPGGGS
jgi:hypothetical protein